MGKGESRAKGMVDSAMVWGRCMRHLTALRNHPFTSRNSVRKTSGTSGQIKNITLTQSDSVISILLHFIMPLSIISTDYMQLDLLYSCFIVCMDRHKKIQVTNTQIYVCVLYSMRKRAVTGITWPPREGGKGKGERAKVSVAVAFFKTSFRPSEKPPPAPTVPLRLGHTYKVNKQNEIKR